MVRVIFYPGDVSFGFGKVKTGKVKCLERTRLHNEWSIRNERLMKFKLQFAYTFVIDAPHRFHVGVDIGRRINFRPAFSYYEVFSPHISPGIRAFEHPVG